MLFLFKFGSSIQHTIIINRKLISKLGYDIQGYLYHSDFHNKEEKKEETFEIVQTIIKLKYLAGYNNL